MKIRTIYGHKIEISRNRLQNAANMSAPDITCIRCFEPCEVAYILDDMSDALIERCVILAPQRDDETDVSRIAELRGCEVCGGGDGG